LFDAEEFRFNFGEDGGFGRGDVGRIGIAAVKTVDVDGGFVGCGCGGEAAYESGGYCPTSGA